MKKIFILFALLSLWACRKDVPQLPPVEEPAKEQAKDITEKKDPETALTPLTPAISEMPEKAQDSIASVEIEANLTREETVFHRLANAILKGDKTCDVSDLNISMRRVGNEPAEYEKLFAKFVKKYPFIFHIETEGSLSVNYKDSDHSVVDKYIIVSKVLTSQMKEWTQRVEKNMEEYYASLAEGMSEVEIAYAIGHQITKRTAYSNTEHGTDLLGALVMGRAICQGYSLAYTMLMENLGIRTDYVQGRDPNIYNGHMWNRILIDGQWYNMDLILLHNRADSCYYCP